MEMSLRDQAYQHIHNQILNGSLSAGDQISEQSLAKEIGMSRTPVREAIRQLQIEGLLTQIPRYGTIVRTPDYDELIELYELREALETYAVEKAAEKINDDQLKQMQHTIDIIAELVDAIKDTDNQRLPDEDIQRFLTADMGFHFLIMQAAGNMRLGKILADCRVMQQIFGYQQNTHDQELLQIALDQHREIIKALQARDPVAAKRCIQEHVQATKQNIMKLYSTNASFTLPNQTPTLTLPPEVTAMLDEVDK